MKQLTRETLKPFQLKAAGNLSNMLVSYPNPPFKKWFNPETGEVYPFICRLKAITGSGKTPMLALSMSVLGNAIVLWTTNRGAVISQTANNLNTDGRYSALLPANTQVLELSDLSSSDWDDVITAQSGLTIILSTVALFNRDDDVLNIHKDRGGISYWDMLAGNGVQPRQRPLYVVYDEAHGGTKAQFSRLTELNPRSIVLASASDLPDDLYPLVPGNTSEEKSIALQNQTVIVPTAEVVEAGLLKNRLYLVDCNTTRYDAIKEANDQWLKLSHKLENLSEWPIMCCIVNSTTAGLEVWETLTQYLGIDPHRVAVHLSGIDKALAEVNPNAPWGLMTNTYKAKKKPEDLRREGYTHLIWNLSLREGWDEPWAYVAYMDGTGKSIIDMSQKMGRFLRQPNAIPFDDGDLNSAYFYFNIPDDEFAGLLRATQTELESQGYEIIPITSNSVRPATSRESSPKQIVEVAKFAEFFGEDLELLDNILIDNVPLFDTSSLRALGRVSTRVLDLLRNEENNDLHKEEQREDNAEISIWEYLVDRLGAQDSRIAKKNGTCFSPFVKNAKCMKQKMQFGSPAMDMINRSLSNILRLLNNELRLVYEPDQVYTIKPFNLVSPDLQVDDVKKRERYRVLRFNNAIHDEYNGLNSFETNISYALDQLGLMWCRNPSKTGYGIPIPEIGQGTVNFYPDFLLWTSKCLWAIDPKGPHLVNDAIYHKLLNVSDIEGLPLKIRVALILEGEYELGINDRPQRRSKNGCTLIRKTTVGIRANHFSSPDLLVKTLK